MVTLRLGLWQQKVPSLLS